MKNKLSKHSEAMFQMLQKRFFCTTLSKSKDPHWRVKQVTKSNFIESFEELKTHISDSDCIAISLQKTGSFSSGWQRVLPFDTAQIAYCKAKRAAERFQLFQFAVCPFSVRASKVVAHPYNFHLFPRDESNPGMPAFSFSCQPSYLTSMAQEGFDFNACIYDGISYLSRAQEGTDTKEKEISPKISQVNKSSLPHSVADVIFTNRVKARIKHWMNVCESPTRTTEESLIHCLRKLILGSDLFGSRPCINIDVCTERQVQLVFQVVEEFSNNLVPLIVRAKGGLIQAVRVVKISSIEERDIVMKELEDSEGVSRKKNRGFGAIIELISASQKPILTHNSLYDLTFVHSKFLGPLPPTMNEFMSSVHIAFPNILDINHLVMGMKLKKFPATDSIHMEIPEEEGEVKNHGHNNLRIIHLFAKLCVSNNNHLALILQNYANIFNPCPPPSSLLAFDEEVNIWARKLSTRDLIFLWGFKHGLSAASLKELLKTSFHIFSSGDEFFDVRLVDKSCAIVAFWQPGTSKRFVDMMGANRVKLCGEIAIRAAGYETYNKACELPVWEADLAHSMDRAESDDSPIRDLMKPCMVYWDTHSMLILEDL